MNKAISEHAYKACPRQDSPALALLSAGLQAGASGRCKYWKSSPEPEADAN